MARAEMKGGAEEVPEAAAEKERVDGDDGELLQWHCKGWEVDEINQQ